MRIRIPLAFLLALTSSTATAQSISDITHSYNVASYRYWFDQDEKANIGTYRDGAVSLDVSALEEGFHTLHYQVQTVGGELSPAYSYPFFRLVDKDEHFKDYSVPTLRYWFDQDTEQRLTAYHSGAATLDVSALEEGFHTLHYQVQTIGGELSPAYSYPFFRLADKEEHFRDYSVPTLRYWFDQETNQRQTAYHSGAATLDVSALEEGFHTLHYQVQTESGELSPAYSYPFFRLANTNEQFDKDYVVKNVLYWFDNDETTSITGNYSGGILQLDLSHLAEGQHTMNYQVVADDGELSPVHSVSFYRNLYDVYVRTTEEYSQSTISADSVLMNKPDLKLHYEAAQTDVRGHLTVADDAVLSLGKFVQTGSLGSNNTSNKYLRGGDEYYHLTTLVNNGFMRADSVIVKERFYRDRWHFVSLPFNANVSDVVVPDGTYWAIRTYDGEQRAAGNMQDVWTNLHSDEQIKAGQGYIVQLTSEKQDKAVELSFASVNDVDKNRIFTTKDVSIPLKEYEAEFAHNRGWNFVGNPYPSFYDTRNIELQGTITVWNGNGYSAYSLTDDNYVLMPFEAFFIQKPLDSDVLMFRAEGRRHSHEAAAQVAKRSRLLSAPGDRRLYNFTLSHDGLEDHARVVMNPGALLGYESDKDAAKFMVNNPTTPQLYSVEGGVKYAINERPVSDGFVTFSMFAPEDGDYLLHVEDTDTEMSLLDTATGEVTALNNSDYSFHADAGYSEARFVVAIGDAQIMSVAQIAAGDDGEIQLVDQCLKYRYLHDKDIRVYGIDGRVYYQARTASGQIHLDKGVYIVSVDGQTTKVVVK